MNKPKCLAQRGVAMAVVASVAASLVACGGGGSNITGTITNSNVATPNANEIVAIAGDPVIIPGNMVTQLNLLKTMSWTAGVDGANPALVLSNDKCLVGAKIDKAIIGSTNGSTGSSNWTCNLGVSTPYNITQDAVYTLGLNATDDKGASYSQAATLRVKPSPDYLAQMNMANPAGRNFDIKSGGLAQLYCQGPVATGTTYQWVVIDGGGYPITLSSYASQASSFTAPVITNGVSAPIVLGCRITDKNSRVSTSTVTVTVKPPVKITSMAAGADFTIRPGQTAPLYCQGPSTGAYAWAVTGNTGGLVLPLSSYSTQGTSFVAPDSVTATTPVELTCTNTDTSLNTVTVSKVVVTITPAPAVDNQAAGKDFNIIEGQVATLFCQGPATSKYSWQVTGNTGKLPIQLSSYNTQQTSFSAPSVSSASPVELTCTETTAAASVKTSKVVVTVLDSSAASATSTLVAKVLAGANVVSPGQTVNFFSTGTGWFDSNGVVTSGPAVTYSWSLGATAPVGAFIANSSAPTANVVIPANAPYGTFSVTLTATSGVQTSSSLVNVVVDPYTNGGFQPVVTPAAQTLTSGSAGTITVSSSATTPQNVYYRWTQVSGPLVTIGGSGTATMGFVTPTVATATNMVFRAEIAYAPFPTTAAYTIDATVTAKP